MTNAKRTREAEARHRLLMLFSHELRTPLNGIQTWAHVLEQQLSTESSGVRNALNGIRSSIGQQVLLVDNFVDLVQAIEGNLSLSKSEIDVRDALSSALEDMRPKAVAANIILATASGLDAAKPIRVIADPVRMRQMLGIMLGNALKSTDAHGTIDVSASPHTDASAKTVRIVVRDAGRRLPAGVVKWLASPFSAHSPEGLFEAPTSSSVDLLLLRYLADFHGGRIEAECAENGNKLMLSMPRTFDRT